MTPANMFKILLIGVGRIHDQSVCTAHKVDKFRSVHWVVMRRVFRKDFVVGHVANTSATVVDTVSEAVAGVV